MALKLVDIGRFSRWEYAISNFRLQCGHANCKFESVQYSRLLDGPAFIECFCCLLLVSNHMWLDFESVDSIGIGYGNSLGRALALAQSFEKNCKYVLLIANLGDEIEKGNISGLKGIASYSERLEEWFTLGRDVSQFKERHNVNAAEVEILRKGVRARNYIAHEAAYPLLMGSKSWEEVRKEVPNYIGQVSSLAQAENLISQWSFEIQEKSTSPNSITTTFPLGVTSWILAPLAESCRDH